MPLMQGLFSLSLPAHDTIGQLGGGQLDQDGILPDALDAAPGDAVALGLPETQKSAVTGDDEGGDLTVLGAEFQSGGVTQLPPVAQVDDLGTEEVGGGDLSHKPIPSHLWASLQIQRAEDREKNIRQMKQNSARAVNPTRRDFVKHGGKASAVISSDEFLEVPL
jgi:hypothetical protein